MGPRTRWLYRIWQVWATLTGRPDLEGLAAVREVLPAPLWGLFSLMPPAEQAHALRVWHGVGGRNAPPALQAAALLHDLGKALHRPALWERVAVVLGKACCPRLVARWGAPPTPPRGWRRPWVVACQHPTWSAALVAAAGGDPQTVAWIAHHQDPNPQDPWLRRLQQADDAA